MPLVLHVSSVAECLQTFCTSESKTINKAVCHLRLLRTFTGVLGEKIRMHAILKENTANDISLERLINVDFGKNINHRFLQFRKRKSQTTTKMTMCSSIELIGYQIQAHWQNNCTVLITKDQSSKVCQHFSIF